MEKGRHKVFKFQLIKLNPNLNNKKLDQNFEKNSNVHQKSTMPWDLCYVV